jgi:hypothetical protein
MNPLIVMNGPSGLMPSLELFSYMSNSSWTIYLGMMTTDCVFYRITNIFLIFRSYIKHRHLTPWIMFSVLYGNLTNLAKTARLDITNL